MISGGETSFVDTTVGPPIGIGPASYPETTIVMAPRSTLLAFTDGLIERRGEDIDRGFQRLADAAADLDMSLEGVLTRLLSTVAEDTAGDDIAILGFRWLAPESPDPIAIAASGSRV